MKFGICLMMVTLALPGFSVFAQDNSEMPPPASQADNTEPLLTPRLPLEELRVFAEAFDRIRQAYVEEIDDQKLLESAIKGLLSQLDPHSAFLDESSFSDLQETTTGNYGGLGIEIGTENGLIKVISPMDETPASRAGILPGDLIIQIDGKAVKSMDVGDAVDQMRGEPGSSVYLMIMRDGESAPLEKTLVREVIKVASTRQRMLEAGYGYVRIAQFQADTGAEVGKAIDELQQDDTIKGLVLDLRNNPGGVLQAAVQVSDLFLESGLIVYTKGRIENSAMQFTASSGDVLANIPIVVLVNEGSASASEIVAGALQDHKRAIILGTTTFGKGSVQTVLPLTNKKAIKLTTALYFTPKGRSIQAEGIVPDIWVERSTVTKIKTNAFRVKEKNLPGHLQQPDAEEANPDNGDTTNRELASSDFQLNEALVLLKGINILAK
jgi:carboxyl-terminal processing protease